MRGCWAVVIWTFWLALLALLVVQARIAMSGQIEIPDGVLRSIEEHFENEGLKLTFSEIKCDTAGHLVMRNVALFSKTLDDPLLKAEAVRCEINPYALMFHKVLPREVRIDGASLRVPAMFSNDGTNAALIDQIYMGLSMKADVLSIVNFSGRAGNLLLLCHGEISLAGATEHKGAGVSVSKILETYLQAARRMAAFLPQTKALGDPVLDVTFAPEVSGFAKAEVLLMADSLNIYATDAHGVTSEVTSCGPMTVGTELMLGEFSSADHGVTDRGHLVENPGRQKPLRIRASTAVMRLASGVQADNVRLFLVAPLAGLRELFERGNDLGGIFKITTSGNTEAQAQDAAVAPLMLPAVDLSLDVTLDLLRTPKIVARAMSAKISGGFPRAVHVETVASVFQQPVGLGADVDFEKKKADVHVVTNLSPQHIDAISGALGTNLGKYVQPRKPIAIDVVAQLASGWQFSEASGVLRSGPLTAYSVPVDSAFGVFRYDRANDALEVSPAEMVIGEDFARGVFATNLKTLDFRFLLRGDLRPPVITPWLGEWWRVFWKDFSFDGPVSHGDVDVRGNWKNGARTNVFVFADASQVVYNKVAFQHVLLSLQARPGNIVMQRLFAAKDNGHAHGTFTYQYRLSDEKPVFTALNFALENLDPKKIAPAISPSVVESLAKLEFFAPIKSLSVTGQLDGAASSRGEHVVLDIEAHSDGALAYDHILLDTLALAMEVRDDAVNIKRFESRVANGQIELKAQVSGPDERRRIGFDLALHKANFGRALQVVGEADARARGQPLPQAGKLQQQLANGVFDLQLSADGYLGDPASFKGNGSAGVRGADLVNLDILGALSQSLRGVPGLNFTTLNLDTAQMNFTIDHNRLNFSEAVLSGPKTMVKLGGVYALDSKYANFTAKVYPLSESKNALARGVGLLLRPITHLTELHLTGPIDSPKWRFSYGPMSLLRTIAGKNDEPPPPAR